MKPIGTIESTRGKQVNYEPVFSEKERDMRIKELEKEGWNCKIIK